MNSLALANHRKRHVAAALAEDLGSGDVTAALIDEEVQVEARIISRERAVLCGSAWLEEVYAQLDASVAVTWHKHDGDDLSAGDTLCVVVGPARPVLSGERSALNYLQFLSATATAAKAYADAVAGTGCKILDTRKTVPGLRLAQKYAVRCGGASNHRTGLFDGILIKENHVCAAGSLSAAITAARALQTTLEIEAEVETIAEFEEALAGGADIIMLDNFNLEDTRAAVTRAAGRARLEASGNITLENVREIAAAGVDYISIGAITKNIKAIDLSMRVTFKQAESD